MCGVIVVSNDPKPVPPPPPSDIGLYLGRLLDRSMETDVTFMVGGEAFPAHRAVLAARSLVFETQLLGFMADATMPSMSITVQDIHPAAFRAMLRFVYTDSWPANAELGDSPVSSLCFQKPSEKVSVDTVGSILAFFFY
jgi:speckle-type POZ protein